MLRFIDWFIPSVNQLSDIERLRYRAFVILSGGGGALGLFNIGIVLLVGLPVDRGIFSLLGFTSLAFVFPFLLRARISLPLLTTISLTYLASVFFVAAFVLGGLQSPALPWIVSLPVLTYYYLKGWWRGLGAVYTVCGVAVLGLLHGIGYPFPYPVPPDLVAPVFGISLVMAMLYILYITHVFASQTRFGKHRLRQAKIEAEKGSEAKSRFLAVISHELRTPLNAIIGFSDLMKGELFGPLGHENYRTYADDIGLSGRNLMAIIENILELTRIETHEVTLNETPFDVRECVDGLVAGLKAKGSIADTATIQVEQPVALPPLFADKGLISRCFSQLISNAVKFSSDTGVVVIKLMSDQRGRFVLRVEDNGIGIEREEIALLSQPFYQADNTLARKYQGLGLGMSLTKSIVELHGGYLTVSSQPGQGSQVTLCLPSWRAARGETAPAPAAEQGGQSVARSGMRRGTLPDEDRVPQ